MTAMPNERLSGRWKDGSLKTELQQRVCMERKPHNGSILCDALRSMYAGLAIFLGLSLVFADAPTPAENASRESAVPALAARLRYPVALTLADEGRLLLTANGRSGSISIVDLQERRVVGEVQLGEALSDLVSLPGSRVGEYFLATNPVAHRLQLLVRTGTELKLLQSLPVSPDPMSAIVDKAGRRCFVASRWSRRLSVIEIVRDPEDTTIRLELVSAIPLPFAPRLQILSPDGERVIVADAFGGKLAVIHNSQLAVESIKILPAVNIRGLAWNSNGTRLLVAHQTISSLANTSVEDIHWGSLVTNRLRSLDFEQFIRIGGKVLAQSDSLLLGNVGDGAADPAGVAVLPDGSLFVALAGTGEVGIGNEKTPGWHRIRVGLRPTALLASPTGEQIYVADTLGDSVSIIENRIATTVSLGPRPELSAAERGERQFFDGRNSHDKWMSCHSCHTDGQSGDLLSDTLGDGSYGAPKRIPPLGGVGQTGPWGWNGSARELSVQVRKSLETTMRFRSISDEQVHDLTEYLMSLAPPRPLNSSAADGDQAAIGRGREIFSAQKCDRCHVPPTFTSPDVYDVGLKDELNNSLFNPPSLRGVSQRTRLLHDGRAADFETVFRKHLHQLAAPLPDNELADLLTFLRSL